MTRTLFRYATPLVTGFFLISLITGVFLYFHTGPAAFRPIHEILSLVLIVPFVLHVWRNWRAFLSYFRRPPMAIGLAVSLLAAAWFFVPSGAPEAAQRGGPPAFAVAQSVMAHSAAEVAPLFGTTGEGLLARLADAGFTVRDPSQPLSEIAAGSGRDVSALQAVLVAH